MEPAQDTSGPGKGMVVLDKIIFEAMSFKRGMAIGLHEKPAMIFKHTGFYNKQARKLSGDKAHCFLLQY
jgi:hypothetical protein